MCSSKLNDEHLDRLRSDLAQARDDRFREHAVLGCTKECDFHVSGELLLPADAAFFDSDNFCNCLVSDRLWRWISGFFSSFSLYTRLTRPLSKARIHSLFHREAELQRSKAVSVPGSSPRAESGESLCYLYFYLYFSASCP
jgi:hypothetical protein